MKQEFDKEIDLLLRNQARASADSPHSEGNGSSALPLEEHLDADELNSYAENVLPLQARARYTEHLADCTRCRQIVTELRQAAGLVITAEPVTVLTLPIWKSFLAWLTAPRFMRYAVPAMVLIVVGVIGLKVLHIDRATRTLSVQQTDGGATIAQNQSTPPALFGSSSDQKPSSKTQPAPPAVTQNREEQTRDNKEAKTPTDDERQKGNVAKNEQPADAIDRISIEPARAPQNTVVVEPKTVVAAENKPEANQAGAQRKGQADSIASADATVPAAKYSEKEAKSPTSVSEPMAMAGARAGSAAKTKSAVANAREQTEDRARAQSEERDEAAKRRERTDKDEAEVRTVSGRRFRKQGSVWVDTEYEGPRATVDVSRGSEQFRALVADEPAIRTIADQLDGEIIVVWKGHVYRIR